jgi:hypothetical protein
MNNLVIIIIIICAIITIIIKKIKNILNRFYTKRIILIRHGQSKGNLDCNCYKKLQ